MNPLIRAISWKQFGAAIDPPYTQSMLLAYLAHERKICHDRIAGLTDEAAARRFINAYRNYSFFEILLYNLRHVQHHTGQLNSLLRQAGIVPPRWVAQTPGDL